MEKKECSFCGLLEDDIEFMVTGPNSYICDECIELCMEMLKDKRDRDKKIKEFERNGGTYLEPTE